MQYLTSLEEYNGTQPSAVTVGKFDGVHLGHRLLTERLQKQKEQGRQVVVVTFDIPPSVRTGNHSDYRLIVTPEEKRYLLSEAGADTMIVLPFTEEFMHLAPEQFIRLLKDKLAMAYMAVGSDFRFGYRGAGNIGLLKDLSVMMDFDLEVVEKKQSNKRDISSTFIREEIAAGHIAKANALLGYPYYIIGEITHGNHIGSTKLNYPTINLVPPTDKLLPPNGVYITEVSVEGRIFKGITNVGLRPTVKEDKKRIHVETHILDFRSDIYEKTAKIIFLEFVRAEQTFASLDDLKHQIGKDIKSAYDYYNHT